MHSTKSAVLFLLLTSMAFAGTFFEAIGVKNETLVPTNSYSIIADAVAYDLAKKYFPQYDYYGPVPHKEASFYNYVTISVPTGMPNWAKTWMPLSITSPYGQACDDYPAGLEIWGQDSGNRIKLYMSNAWEHLDFDDLHFRAPSGNGHSDVFFMGSESIYSYIKPATNSNDGSVATTEWVNDRLRENAPTILDIRTTGPTDAVRDYLKEHPGTPILYGIDGSTQSPYVYFPSYSGDYPDSAPNYYVAFAADESTAYYMIFGWSASDVSERIIRMGELQIPELLSVNRVIPSGSWWQTSGQTTGSFLGVTYANGKFVAYTAYPYRTYTSTDGVTWTQPSMTLYVGINCISGGNGVFVIGTSNGIYYSYNGLAWDKSTIPDPTANITDITFGDGRFVAITDNKTLRSEDGIHWYQSEQTIDYCYCLGFGNGKFIAGGDLPWYSVDGKSWKTRNLYYPSFTDIAYDHGLFVAAATYAGIYYSTDGEVWTKVMPIPASFLHVATGGGKFIASTEGSPGKIYCSENGINWGLCAQVAGEIRGLAYGNNVFVAATSNGILFSPATGSITTPVVQAIKYGSTTIDPDPYNVVDLSQGKMYPMFILDLNPDTGTSWLDFELKATTNNFAETPGNPLGELIFWGASSDNQEYGPILHDWFRLYVSGVGKDKRRLIRIRNSADLVTFAPRKVVILICPTDPGFMRRGQGINWCNEANKNLTWTYLRYGSSTYEKQPPSTSEPAWREIQPVRWFYSLPDWAN